MTLRPAPESFSRIVIEHVTPEIDAGRYPAKCCEGDTVEVQADIFTDGHGLLRAMLYHRRKGLEAWRRVEFAFPDNDRWTAFFTPEEPGRYEYTIKAWPDLFATWREGTLKKREDGQDIALELQEGVELVNKLIGEEALAAAKRKSGKAKAAAAPKEAADLNVLRERLNNPEDKNFADYILSKDTLALVQKHASHPGEVEYGKILEVQADRIRAEFSAWYEMFPRSQGKPGSKSGTFRDCEARLADIKAMGFDVVYFPPIHPIGVAHRKGRNNALAAQPGDPGSPYAIGGREGGHKSLHPELGTLEDFRRFVSAAHALDMDVALDFAVQVSRDHPYIKEHPEWFSFRPDGTIQYAENPPKKYEDIANVNFEAGGELWEELRSIVLFWIEQGVTIFRVDNPHTKPFAFWEWLIGSIQENRPDIIFLAEAFTRPKPMYLLAKLGFTQSYTYFTWRHSKAEFIAYMTELTTAPVKDFFRPNFFPTTPDILPPYIQQGGKPAFLVRLTLAATLSGNYGMLAGYELLEGEGLAGKEEYADSEKYEIKPRDWDAPGNIKDFVASLNCIRQENPSMQKMATLAFYFASDDTILFYGRVSIAHKNAVFVAVNLDCFAAHDAFIELPLAMLNIAPDESYTLDDLLLGHSWQWTGARQHVRLDPSINPVAIFRIKLP